MNTSYGRMWRGGRLVSLGFYRICSTDDVQYSVDFCVKFSLVETIVGLDLRKMETDDLSMDSRHE